MNIETIAAFLHEWESCTHFRDTFKAFRQEFHFFFKDKWQTVKTSPPNQALPFSSTSFSLIISQRNDTRSTECAQSRSICTEEADTRPIESERRKIRKKNPDKEVIHSQPVEEVAMDTAGPERSEMSRGHEEKSIWSQAGDKEENCRVTKEASQLLSTYTCVCVLCSRSPFMLTVCCSRCWPQSQWKLWEWRCQRTGLVAAAVWSHNKAVTKTSKNRDEVCSQLPAWIQMTS